jgi:autoinducer-2 kinase
MTLAIDLCSYSVLGHRRRNHRPQRAAGRRIRIPKVREATSLGGAIAAVVGLGLYAGLVDAADAMVRWERELEPNPAHRATYDEAAERWTAAYAVQKSLVDRKITTPMWSAPGAILD